MGTQGSSAGDRRRVCRYAAALEDAFLGWWQDSTFSNVPARLVDLSLNGCLLEVDRLPDMDLQQAVFVHLNKESQLSWIEGRLVAIRKRLLRKCEVRIKFLESLPYEPFKKVVYGPQYLQESTPTSKPTHETDGFWK